MNNYDLSPRLTSWVLLGISALIPFFIIIPQYFPYLGLSIACAVLSSMVYLVVQKRRFHVLLYLSALICSFFIVMRANPLLTFLNFVAVIYLNAVLIRHQTHGTLSLFSLIVSPLTVFFKSLTKSDSAYAIRVKDVLSKKARFTTQHIGSNLLAWGITVLVLLVIVPLLSSANPLFGRLVADIVGLFSLEQFFTFLTSSTGMMYSVRLITFLVLVVLLPRLLAYTTSRSESVAKQTGSSNLLNLAVPKLAVIFVLLVFFVTQLQLYFSTELTLQALGYTHSQYAREVFGQLTLVTLIVFALLYGDRSNSRMSRILTYILSIQALFLTLIAGKSDYDYSNAWGFTYKRLWGFAGVVWTFGLFSLFVRSYVLHAPRHQLLKQIVLLTSTTLITITMVNFDYLIYHHAKTTLPTGTDYYYLSYLTPDSYSYHVHLPYLIQKIQEQERPETDSRRDDESLRMKNLSAAQHMVYTIRQLREKYSNAHLFAYNYAQFKAYSTTASLPLDEYEEILRKESEYLHRSFPEPQPIIIEEYR